MIVQGDIGTLANQGFQESSEIHGVPLTSANSALKVVHNLVHIGGGAESGLFLVW